jgi:hypothetical protein
MERDEEPEPPDPREAGGVEVVRADGLVALRLPDGAGGHIVVEGRPSAYDARVLRVRLGPGDRLGATHWYSRETDPIGAVRLFLRRASGRVLKLHEVALGEDVGPAFETLSDAPALREAAAAIARAAGCAWAGELAGEASAPRWDA